jgi:hypothetical protein
MHLFGIASYDATDIFIFIFYFSWSTSYEDLLSTNEPFAERIPLPVRFQYPYLKEYA